MNPTHEMKEVRNYLRHQIKLIKADPYLASVAANVSARIVKWNKNEHSVLVCVRDISQPETPYNSRYCRWIWTHTWSSRDTRFWKWDIWKELNALVGEMRYPSRSQYPF